MSYHGYFAHGTYENSKSGPIMSNHPTTQVFLLKSLEQFGRGQTLGTRRSPFNFAVYFLLVFLFSRCLFPQNLFQLFFSTEWLEWGPNLPSSFRTRRLVTVTPQALLMETWRVLKPSGLLILVSHSGKRMKLSRSHGSWRCIELRRCRLSPQVGIDRSLLFFFGGGVNPG